MIVRKDECDDWLIELVADPTDSDAWFDNFGGFELVLTSTSAASRRKRQRVLPGEVTPLSAGQSRLATRRRAHGRLAGSRLTREPARAGGSRKPASARAFALWLSGPAAEAEETKFGRPVAVPFRLTAQPMEAHPSAPFIASSAFRRDRSNKNFEAMLKQSGTETQLPNRRRSS